MNCGNIGSGNGMSPIRRQAVTWTNVGLLSTGPLATNFDEIRINKNKQTFFIHKIAFRTKVYEMVAIFSPEEMS